MKSAADFHVGQLVRCLNPNAFRADYAKKLENRTGEVIRVFPRTEERHVRNNELQIKWLKRNGRGKEFLMFMNPHHLAPA